MRVLSLDTRDVPNPVRGDTPVYDMRVELDADGAQAEYILDPWDESVVKWGRDRVGNRDYVPVPDAEAVAAWRAYAEYGK